MEEKKEYASPAFTVYLFETAIVTAEGGRPDGSDVDPFMLDPAGLISMRDD